MACITATFNDANISLDTDRHRHEVGRASVTSDSDAWKGIERDWFSSSSSVGLGFS